MLTQEDKDLWEAYTKTVTPLKSHKNHKIRDLFFPHLWFVPKKKKSLPNVLDLHQMTMQEAFHIFDRFLQMHYNLGTKKIIVITGRGKEDKGSLKKEFPFWLENENIKNKIKCFCLQNEGSFEIELRKRKC